jgi:nickel-dependent lactate racemase
LRDPAGRPAGGVVSRNATQGVGMQIEVPYGKERVTIEIDESNFAGAVQPNDVEVGDEAATLERALAAPFGPKTFSGFLSDAEDVVVIVNDRTRPTPTAKVLELIYPELKRIKNVKFVVATGVHRAPTEDEYVEMFGKYLDVCRNNIISHDARKSEDMVYLGTSKNGTEMYVNRHVTDAKKIIIIGSVEPHYFAGYTGGRKSFLPGVASFETIEQNHKYALLPAAQPLALEGNPVHEDMVDAIKCISDHDIFTIMTVLDRKHRIYAATAGDIDEAFYAAIDKAHDVFSVTIDGREDIVVAVAPYPMDVDLYQSQKALDNGKLAMKDGGILILVAECRSGIGEEAFAKLLSSADTPDEVMQKIDEGYKLGYHKAAKIAEIAMRGEMWAVSCLADEELESIFIRPFPDLQSAIDAALEKKGKDAKILFLMAASMTVPRVV